MLLIRNKIRRRIKESYRLNIDANVKYGYDIVFIARVAIKEADYKDIEKSMNHLIKKSRINIKSIFFALEVYILKKKILYIKGN